MSWGLGAATGLAIGMGLGGMGGHGGGGGESASICHGARYRCDKAQAWEDLESQSGRSVMITSGPLVDPCCLPDYAITEEEYKAKQLKKGHKQK